MAGLGNLGIQPVPSPRWISGRRWAALYRVTLLTLAVSSAAADDWYVLHGIAGPKGHLPHDHEVSPPKETRLLAPPVRWSILLEAGEQQKADSATANVSLADETGQAAMLRPKAASDMPGLASACSKLPK